MDMTAEMLGEMFKGDSADMCAGKFPLVSMGGRADPSNVRRWGARTPHRREWKFNLDITRNMTGGL